MARSCLSALGIQTYDLVVLIRVRRMSRNLVHEWFVLLADV
jgi:hypothetical protein